ncbi:transmembrane protein 104-like [Clytia hemisphaerica]|uniref:Amino acid transporter transmembrane domain-containing protein n=1 Tax=Clytia hemisphaerica TaxID=252671 RepID=A0A7M5U1Q7_9CNID|eukprot:TCONS_00062623-protein
MADGQDGYTWQIAYVYLFNLIVGAGALTMPQAFAQTGWVLGTVAMAVLALMSFCTSTFMIEAMSIGNAMIRLKNQKQQPNVISRTPDDPDDSGNELEPAEGSPLLINSDEHSSGDLYGIDKKVEMGDLAEMFFSKAGLIAYYVVIALYLYGDLAIYAAAVPKSMTQAICGGGSKLFENGDLPCGNVSSMSVFDMYRITLLIFVVCLCPFVFFNLAKTKFLQIATTIFRWAAFLCMVSLAVNRVVHKKSTHRAVIFEFNALPNFFGVAVYSFMCHHSLPSIITPVTNKRRILYVLFGDFVAVFFFYMLLVTTAVFAFKVDDLKDLYTLSFTDAPDVLKYFLELFPTFTLSTNFPIIAITLRENLKNLFLKENKYYGLFVRRFLFPLAVIIPPIIIAFATDDVEMLVSITGTYAGAVIQYVVPVMLVFYGRRSVLAKLGNYINKNRSPFRSQGWVYLIVTWYFVCTVFVTVNKFYKFK